MGASITDIYREWTILVVAQPNKCANFSFEVTSPSGQTQHVSMGGENVQRAIERAREMIDMEIAFAEEE